MQPAHEGDERFTGEQWAREGRKRPRALTTAVGRFYMNFGLRSPRLGATIRSSLQVIHADLQVSPYCS